MAILTYNLVLDFTYIDFTYTTQVWYNYISNKERCMSYVICTKIKYEIYKYIHMHMSSRLLFFMVDD